MTNPIVRSPQRRRLGALLRRLRKDARLSGEELAAALGVSQSHLSRVELGDSAATADLVDRWTARCSGSPDDREEAAELASAVNREFTHWRKATAQGLPALQRVVAAAEESARTISAWVPGLIPGLLQMGGYTHALISGELPDRTDVAEAVVARMERQAVLYRRDKRLRWVIGEAGLRWRVAPDEIMLAQLDRVATLALEPHLDLRVLPFARTAAVWHDHGFTMKLDRSDHEPDLVNLELLTGEVAVTDPADVAEYRQAYERLAGSALAGSEAATFVREVMADFR